MNYLETFRKITHILMKMVPEKSDFNFVQLSNSNDFNTIRVLRLKSRQDTEKISLNV